MKTILLILFLLPAGFVTAGATQTPPPAGSRTPPVPTHELASVDQFLDLSDADLDQLQRVIARIRAMPAAQRAELRREIEQYRELPEPRREQLRRGWGWMPREIQDGWREMMQQATPERRAAIQRELQALDPAGKADRRRQLVEAYLKAKTPAAQP